MIAVERESFIKEIQVIKIKGRVGREESRRDLFLLHKWYSILLQCFMLVFHEVCILRKSGYCLDICLSV